MRRPLVGILCALTVLAAGIAGEASVVGLLEPPLAVATTFAGIAATVPLTVAAPAAISLGMSGFTMVALRRETDLPLVISGMIVPVVVLLGFGIAVVGHRFTGFSLVESAVGLGLVLFGLVFAKQMVDPEP